MNILATVLIALASLSTATVAVLEPTCTDLAGQGSLCHEATIDPEGGNVDVDAVLVLAPQLPPPPALAAVSVAEPSCTDLAGQGSLCTEVTADPEGGNFDVDAVLVIAPQPPL